MSMVPCCFVPSCSAYFHIIVKLHQHENFGCLGNERKNHDIARSGAMETSWMLCAPISQASSRENAALSHLGPYLSCDTGQSESGSCRVYLHFIPHNQNRDSLCSLPRQVWGNPTDLGNHEIRNSNSGKTTRRALIERDRDDLAF